MRFRIVHDNAAGRLRFSVPDLYRSKLVRQRIEQVLANVTQIRSVRASELTGKVLIRYAPTISQTEIQGLLDEALEGVLPSSSSKTDKARKNTLGANAEKKADFGHDIVLSPDTKWHAQTVEEILNILGVNIDDGLSMHEARQRLKKYGPNLIAQQESRPDLFILLEQFKSLPVAMLGVSAGVSLVTGGRVDAVVILGVVAINAIIGFYTERQAERTIASLGAMTPRDANVFRGGTLRQVSVEKLVPGDVLELSPGMQIAADARLVNARRLSIDESALTGESMPVSKKAVDKLNLDTPLSNRRNMLYTGTMVTGGNAKAVVVDTGLNTELGQVQALVDSTRPPETPMEKQLGRMSTQLGILSGAACAGIFGIGLLRGQHAMQMLNAAISLAVAAVPEGLPAVATTTMALGIRDMNKHNAAVRKVEAVETLGSVQVICLDKTGTLTLNHMTAVAVSTMTQDMTISNGRFQIDGEDLDANQSKDLSQLLKVITLCSEADYNKDVLEGSPTEMALIELAEANGANLCDMRQAFPRLELRGRAEGRPLMSTIHQFGEQEFIAVKGRPAEILSRCTHKQQSGRKLVLREADKKAILHTNENLASKALRVLGIAYRLNGHGEKRDAENLVWLGMVGMQDPLRPGMPELMRQFHQAGIKTIMITGDQSATAYAIANELGLAGGGSTEILDSTSLEKMDPELLAGIVRKVDVFSRVSPAHKLMIVQAMQSAGLVVAMTGDGVNDGPALKAADIGVAMGKHGSDIARSVSDVVIGDDNLHTMATAVREGRTIYNNIRKTIHYLLSTNFSEIEVMLTSILIGSGNPLNPMQLLWINLVTDIFPGLALSMESPDPETMEQPPRPSDAPIITNKRLAIMASESAVITVSALTAHLYGRLTGGPERGSTLAFHTLTFAQLLHALSCRSNRHGLFNPVLRPKNKWLNMALLGTTAGQMATILAPPLRRLMGTTTIRPLDLLVISAGASLPLIVNEAVKAYRYYDETGVLPRTKTNEAAAS